MPRFDQHCLSCDWTGDVIAKPFEMPPCPACGEATERYYPIGGRGHGVIGDEFVGGKWIENMGPQPVYVESRSHYKRELAARGLEEKVRHVGQNYGDKSSITTRWY
jgi:hypothetical protein